MYIKRLIESVLDKNLKFFPAISITGPRQTGKTTLLKEKYGKEYSYVSFDDPFNRELALNDPNLLIQSRSDKIIFDEIQYVPTLLPYIKIKIDENPALKGRYILTGSEQFSLIKGLSETLAGRIAIFNLLPFSFKEIINYTVENRKTLDYFLTASLRGLYPGVVVNKGIDINLWYSSYLQTYLERDIHGLYNIGNLRDFTQFIKIIASRCGQLLNMSTISRDIGVSVNTIKNWISALEASRVIYLLKPYYKNLGKRITQSPKIYFTDTAMVCYLTGIQTKEHMLNSPLSGALFENLVISETLKMFYNKAINPNLYYLRTSNNLEIDLLIEIDNQIKAYEIKLSQTPTLVMAKWLNQASLLFKDLNIVEKNIVCLKDGEAQITNDIKALGLEEYLDHLEKSGQ